MNKSVIAVFSVLLLMGAFYFGHQYVNGPKIVEGVVTNERPVEGKSMESKEVFESDEPVYFTAKGNRFWVKEAHVIWYKGEIRTGNRYLEEVVKISDGSFTAELSVPEGLEEGIYGVGIYAKGNDVMETKVLFEVKKQEEVEQ